MSECIMAKSHKHTSDWSIILIKFKVDLKKKIVLDVTTSHSQAITRMLGPFYIDVSIGILLTNKKMILESD